MRLFSGVAAVIALMSMPTTAYAEAEAEGPCLTESEATAMFDYALPELLASVAKKCSSTLPKSSFLVAQANQYLARYRTAADATWPLAKAAFLKAASGSEKEAKLMAAVSDDAMKNILGVGLGAAVTDGINPADCPRVDKIVAALAPLPPNNISMIIVQIMALDSNKPGKKSDFKLCEA